METEDDEVFRRGTVMTIVNRDLWPEVVPRWTLEGADGRTIGCVSDMEIELVGEQS